MGTDQPRRDPNRTEKKREENDAWASVLAYLPVPEPLAFRNSIWTIFPGVKLKMKQASGLEQRLLQGREEVSILLILEKAAMDCDL